MRSKCPKLAWAALRAAACVFVAFWVWNAAVVCCGVLVLRARARDGVFGGGRSCSLEGGVRSEFSEVTQARPTPRGRTLGHWASPVPCTKADPTYPTPAGACACGADDAVTGEEAEDEGERRTARPCVERLVRPRRAGTG
jgi:hypothetical protein